jgi:hypothetical protein
MPGRLVLLLRCSAASLLERAGCAARLMFAPSTVFLTARALPRDTSAIRGSLKVKDGGHADLLPSARVGGDARPTAKENEMRMTWDGSRITTPER